MKHSDRDLPDGLLSRIPSMSHEELSTTLSQLASTAADRNSCVPPSREGENADSDGTQDFEVTAAFCYIVTHTGTHTRTVILMGIFQVNLG